MVSIQKLFGIYTSLFVIYVSNFSLPWLTGIMTVYEMTIGLDIWNNSEKLIALCLEHSTLAVSPGRPDSAYPLAGPIVLRVLLEILSKWNIQFNFTRRYSPLRKGLRPMAEAFFALWAKKAPVMLFLLILGHFWCSVVTSLT